MFRGSDHNLLKQPLFENEHVLDIPNNEDEESIADSTSGQEPPKRTTSLNPTSLRLTLVRTPSSLPVRDATDGEITQTIFTIGQNTANMTQEEEVEMLTGAVVEAVADAAAAKVNQAVQEAVQTAIDETYLQFNIKANFYTLIAVAAAVLLERGIWTLFDYFFGTESLVSAIGSLALGLVVLLAIRLLNLPLVSSIPGR